MVTIGRDPRAVRRSHTQPLLYIMYIIGLSGGWLLCCSSSGLDWKSDSHLEFSDRTGEPPSSIPVAEAESVQFALSGSVLPSQLHIAVYHGAASEIDPLSQPDHTLICTDSSEEPCHLKMVQGSVVFEISKELFPADLRGVLGISAEYLAQPELNSERFVNLINWAVEFSPK